jgi:hypothetical protein
MEFDNNSSSYHHHLLGDRLEYLMDPLLYSHTYPKASYICRFDYTSSLSRPMDESLNSPPIRLPTSIPSTTNLLVTLQADPSVGPFFIPNPLNPETIPDSVQSQATLLSLNRIRETLTSPFNTPDRVFDRETWLKLVLELFAAIHEGFRNAQLAAPDYQDTDTFLQLTSDEIDLVSRIPEVLDWINDFCDPKSDEVDVRTLCIRCVESTVVPDPPEDLVKSFQLSNELQARAFKETLFNEALCKAHHEVDEWREQQHAACISYLTSIITSSTPDPVTLAKQVGNLDLGQ